MKKELNTSCKAIYKDGTEEEFKSIEEASAKTGISVASIKIRCNRKGCIGKDKTAFVWLDEHTKKSYQAKKSKSKGGALEYQIVKELKDLGFTGCVTSKGESKRMDNNKIDIIDTENRLPVNIQCKHYSNTPNYFKISNECTDKSKPFCIVWKKSAGEEGVSPGTVIIIPKQFFYDLLKAYTEINNIEDD